MSKTPISYEKDRFVRDNIPDDVICTYCDQVLYNPVQCGKCRQYYCYECSKHEDNQYNCKHDIPPLSSLSQSIKYLKNKIDELIIKCKFWKNGCAFSNKVALIDKHESNCNYGNMVLTPVSKANLQNMAKTPKTKRTGKQFSIDINCQGGNVLGRGHIRANSNCIGNSGKCDQCALNISSSSPMVQKENFNNHYHNCIDYLKLLNENKQLKIREQDEIIEHLHREKIEIKILYENYLKSSSEQIDYFSSKIGELQNDIDNLRAENQYLKKQLNINNDERKYLKHIQNLLEEKLHSFIYKSQTEFENFKDNMHKKFVEFFGHTRESYSSFQTKICDEFIANITNNSKICSDTSCVPNYNSESLSKVNDSGASKTNTDSDYDQYKVVVYTSNELSKSHDIDDDMKISMDYASNKNNKGRNTNLDHIELDQEDKTNLSCLTNFSSLVN